MNWFHLLILDSTRTDLQAVLKYELSGFDSTSLWEGRRFSEPIPKGVRLWVSDGMVADYLGNPLSWPICSARFLSLLQRRAGSDFQAFNAPVFDQVNHPVSSYWLINILTKVDCLDRERSNITYMTIEGQALPCINEYVIDHTKVPSGVHIFRIPDSPSAVIISDALAQDMVGKRLTGIALVRISGGR